MSTQGSGAGLALRRCVAVDAGEFAERYWDREALLSKRIGDFTDLLSLPTSTNCSAAGACVRRSCGGQGGHVDAGPPTPAAAAPARRSATRSSTSGSSGCTPDGATLVLQGLHRLWPAADRLRRRPAHRELGTPVQINAYLTPPEQPRFATHYDTHAVFVLQVAGRKHWRVHRRW